MQDNKLVKCMYCKYEKPQSEYNANRTRKSGYVPYCKQCESRVKRDYYTRNREKILARVAKYDKSTKSIEVKRKTAKRMVDKYPEKHRARELLKAAVRLGKIEKFPCYCGNINSQGHHRDYSKPFEVVWLCSPHHHELHMDLRYLTNFYTYFQLEEVKE